jgi:prophage antirepressor-like protein
MEDNIGEKFDQCISEVIPEIELNTFFNELPIRIVGTQSKPMFYAEDIGKILGLSKRQLGYVLQKHCNERHIVSREEKEEHGIKTYRRDGKKRNDMLLLTEFGVHKLLILSNGELPERFSTWVEDVLYKLRTTGEYKIQQELKELRAKNETLLASNGKLIEENKKILKDIDTFYQITDKLTIFRIKNNVKKIQTSKMLPEEDQFTSDDSDEEFTDEECDEIDKLNEYYKAFPEEKEERKYSYKITINPTTNDYNYYHRIFRMHVKNADAVMYELSIRLREYMTGKMVFSCTEQKILSAVRGVIVDLNNKEPKTTEDKLKQINGNW